jgi:hypothetical protein
MTLGRTRSHYVSQTRESAQGMFCIVVVPGHAIAIEESEQFVVFLSIRFLRASPGFCSTFHGGNVLDESCGWFPVLI